MGVFTTSFYYFIVLSIPNMDIIEAELQHRLRYKYIWYRRQNDRWDGYSNFIYRIVEWKKLIPRIEETIKIKNLNKEEFFYYAINRWYNYWSACAVEQIFTDFKGVIAEKNTKNKTIDFSFFGKNVDHKTSVFPRGFGKSLAYAQQFPEAFLLWLYRNQSQEQRKHMENRMFLIVYAKNGAHWKLKAEISWLKDVISTYVTTFDDSKFYQLQLLPNKITSAGLIWAVK